MRRLRLAASCVLAAALAACSSFGETHYFKAVDENGVARNYYRMNVSGYARLSSSRYLSGYYNDDVVDAYFNEVSQPKGGALGVSGAKSSEPGIKPLDGSKEGKKLVM